MKLFFPERLAQTGKYSWKILYEYLSGLLKPTEGEITRLCLCHIVFMINFAWFKLYGSKT